jgi:hypothetical protein
MQIDFVHDEGEFKSFLRTSLQRPKTINPRSHAAYTSVRTFEELVSLRLLR